MHPQQHSQNPERQAQPAFTSGELESLKSTISRSSLQNWSVSRNDRQEVEVLHGVTRKKEVFDVTSWTIPHKLDDTLLLTAYDRPKAEINNPFEFFGDTRRSGIDFDGDLFSWKRPGMCTAQAGGKFVQNKQAFELLDLVREELRTAETIAQKYLTSLAEDPAKLSRLSWVRKLSEDERETIYQAEKDGFVLQISCLEKSAMLDHCVRIYSAEISLNGTLVGPVHVQGEKAEKLFKYLNRARGAAGKE